jgi:hypothetical protein
LNWPTANSNRRNSDWHADQAEGERVSVNESEARLAEQSRQTFLSMWSYQNPHYGKRKELCDVLVVYGDDIIVISDKVIEFKARRGLEVAWKAWYKRAIEESVNQLRGAMKTIQRHPETIYLDADCSSPFPLELPVNARIHLVAVAHGAEEACQSALGRPSLVIDSRPEGVEDAFHVGVRHPEFVHVLNRTGLDALFSCFDTAVDLIEYLRQKEQLFAEEGGWVHGEEDLIALYMRLRQPGRQIQLTKVAAQREPGQPIASAEWQVLRASPDFLQRREKLAPSYLIDDIIEQVGREYAGGRMLIGQELALAAHEAAFRTLASEPRLGRLLIGTPLAEVLTEDPTTFWGEAVESPEHSDVLYVWLIYPVVPDEIDHEALERATGNLLSKYVYVAMAKFPKAHRFFGIAMPNSQSKRTSRLFCFTERKVWTEAMQHQAEAISRRENIFSDIESTVYIARHAI